MLILAMCCRMSWLVLLLVAIGAAAALYWLLPGGSAVTPVPPRRILLLGGRGAVGQSFGAVLKRNGHTVVHYSRSAAPVQQRVLYDLGQRMWPWRLFAKRRAGEAAAVLPECPILSSEGEVKAMVERDGPFHQVWVLIPSDAILSPSTLSLLSLPCLADASIVAWSPTGPEERAALSAAGVDVSKRLVAGTISLIAYQAPLAGTAEEEEMSPEKGGSGPGIAVLVPPGPQALCPPADPSQRWRADEAASVLSCPASSSSSSSTSSSFRIPAAVDPLTVALAELFLEPVMACLVFGLEAAGWSVAALRRNGALLALSARASKEASLIAERSMANSSEGGAPPATSLSTRLVVWLLRGVLARPLAFRLIAALAPRVLPFPFEAYMRLHFGHKVRSQMHTYLRHLLSRAAQLGVPAPSLTALEQQLQNAN